MDIDEDGNVDYDEFMTMIEQIVDQVTGMYVLLNFIACQILNYNSGKSIIATLHIYFL